MEMITDMPAGEVEQAPREPLFTPDQQKAFDKAFRKREAKIRGEYGRMRSDLLETIEVTHHLLERCNDRISVEDECAIRDGLRALRRDYQCQKR